MKMPRAKAPRARRAPADGHGPPTAGRIETLAIHAGQPPEPRTGAVMTPVFLTSTYAQRGPGEHTGFEYSRTQNPTRFALEANLAALEGGSWGLAFNAGLAASTAVGQMTTRAPNARNPATFSGDILSGMTKTVA